MKNAIPLKFIFVFIFVFSNNLLPAQENEISELYNTDMQETHKRVDHYLELKKMGYEEQEIFKDLGNANFLAENYVTALFWYDKLKEYSPNGALSTNYQKRYHYAFRKTQGLQVAEVPQHNDWLTMVKYDYEIGKKANAGIASNNESNIGSQLKSENFVAKGTSHRKYPLNTEKSKKENIYEIPIALTADGNTAYFSKSVYQKPLHGLFSKKELVHKMYQANKIDGEWKEINEIKLCPKYASALHPTVSNDGKRLFFASNMPGSLGDYDIYVTNINSDGSFGKVKNLGDKINTKKNELYPSLAGGNTLFFASEGHAGEGGLDIYMAQVEQRNVGFAMNLGKTINSEEDDFSISFQSKDGMGYVMSNRGGNSESIQQVAFSYNGNNSVRSYNKREYNFADVISSDLKVDYTSTLFEDE